MKDENGRTKLFLDEINCARSIRTGSYPSPCRFAGNSRYPNTLQRSRASCARTVLLRPVLHRIVRWRLFNTMFRFQRRQVEKVGPEAAYPRRQAKFGHPAQTFVILPAARRIASVLSVNLSTNPTRKKRGERVLQINSMNDWGIKCLNDALVPI